MQNELLQQNHFVFAIGYSTDIAKDTFYLEAPSF